MRELDNEDSRTVTLIADPGTEQEKIYSQIVGKGCSVSLVQQQQSFVCRM